MRDGFCACKLVVSQIGGGFSIGLRAGQVQPPPHPTPMMGRRTIRVERNSNWRSSLFNHPNDDDREELESCGAGLNLQFEFLSLWTLYFFGKMENSELMNQGNRTFEEQGIITGPSRQGRTVMARKLFMSKRRVWSSSRRARRNREEIRGWTTVSSSAAISTRALNSTNRTMARPPIFFRTARHPRCRRAPRRMRSDLRKLRPTLAAQRNRGDRPWRPP